MANVRVKFSNILPDNSNLILASYSENQLLAN